MGLALLHSEWRGGREHALIKVLQNANKMVVKEDGTMHMPRGGLQYHEAKRYHEMGKFDQWLSARIGSPSDEIVELADFLY